MEIIYYIHVNGQQIGPLQKDQLRSSGLTPETMVWRSDLPNWVKASTLPELAELFIPPTPSNINYVPDNGPTQSNGYGMPLNNRYENYDHQRFERPLTNWMPWAIIATVLACFTSCIGLIFGIIGIVNAGKANKLVASGNYPEAKAANDMARTMTIIALVLDAIAVFVLFNYMGALLSFYSSIY